jgi:MFS family permease
MVQLTTGAFLTGYLLALGSGSIVIGIAAALPLLVKLSQLYTSWRIERGGGWWRTAIRGAMVGRLPFFLAALLPFVDMPPDLRAGLLIVIVAITSLGGAAWEIAFLTWMAELIPLRVRGEFWGRRTRVAEIFGLVVALGASVLFDRWRAGHPGGLEGFAAIFGVAGIAGALGILFLTMIPHPAHSSVRSEPASLASTLIRPARDTNFRRLLIFVAVWGFSVGLLGPFTSVYMLKELHLSFVPITILNILPSGIIALTQAYWGKLSDHFGNKPVLRVSTYIVGAFTVLWLASAPGRWWPLLILQAASGFGWSAYNLTMNNIVLKIAPAGSRSSYVASIGAVTALSQAAAPIVGGVMLSFMQGAGVEPILTYYILFAAAFLVRLGATPLLGPLDEPEGMPVGHMIRVLGRFRSMGGSGGADLIFDYTYTQIARIADFVTRENRRHGVRRMRKRGG